MSLAFANSSSSGAQGCDIESLSKEYCPPLEAGLVYAIASDFDLSQKENVDELRKALDELKDSAVIEQDLELLPQDDNYKLPEKSRLLHPDTIPQTLENDSSRRSKSSPGSTTEDDGVASVTTGISGLRSSNVDDGDFSHDSGYGEASTDFENLTENDKRALLKTMFPNVAESHIADVLARCNAQFDKSTDELLNISFLEQNSEKYDEKDYEAPKGVDGFVKDVDDASNKKSKAKARRTKIRTDFKTSSETLHHESPASSGASAPNTWQNLPEDVDFIASRTHLKPKLINSVYHTNGDRLAPTVRALAIKEGEIYAKAPHKVSEIMEWQMDELRLEYSHVPDAQIYGALMLTNNIPSTAKELLDAMIASDEQPVLPGKITGLVSYSPINLTDDETIPKKASRSPLPPAIPTGGIVYTTSHIANKHGMAASQAFQQASTAYKRGKSDHLMGGAAAYYASVGHEKIKAAKQLQAWAADAHVAAQSSSMLLDLHGVNVSDAVRIAQSGTEAWWEGLGDSKYVVGGKGNGYRIVTGAGRHSSDGIGRIGPAVSKMLVREGWKVEVGRGEVVVLGRARR